MTIVMITGDGNGEKGVDIEAETDLPDDSTPLEQHATAMMIVAQALVVMAEHTPFLASNAEATDGSGDS